jgi:phenylacetate-CoA ligase
MGYASTLYTFAQRMEAAGLTLAFAPKVVLSVCEALFDFQRETIARAFSCPAACEYSARDAGVLAFECPKGGLHIASENVLLEALEPETLVPLPVGQVGLLAVTELNNLSMPRLRYLLGDMAALSGGSCSCGLSLPLMESPEGRVEELLVTPWGRLAHGHAFARLAHMSPSVKQFQLIQRSPERVILKIVRDLDRPEDDTEEFIAKTRSALPGVTVEVDIAGDIPLTPSGKHCYALQDPEPVFSPEAGAALDAALNAGQREDTEAPSL